MTRNQALRPERVEGGRRHPHHRGLRLGLRQRRLAARTSSCPARSPSRCKRQARRCSGSTDSDQPIGVWDEVEETDKGLLRARAASSTPPLGNDAYKLAKAGAIKGLSIGYTPEEARDRPREGHPQADSRWSCTRCRSSPSRPTRRPQITRVKSQTARHDRARVRGIPAGRRRTEPEGGEDRGLRRLQGIAEAPGR